MSITDELREWSHGFNGPWKRNEEMLTAIADRIDAEHEAKVAYWRGASYKDGYDDGFASADDWLAQHEDAMAEHGWVRLPKDADGEYIHVGDVMEFSAFEVGKPPTRMVDGIGQGVFFAWCGERGYQQHEAKRYRHYHAPTVEDVLRDVVTLCRNTWKEGSAFEFYDVDDVMKSGNIAKYAAKLSGAAMVPRYCPNCGRRVEVNDG